MVYGVQWLVLDRSDTLAAHTSNSHQDGNCPTLSGHIQLCMSDAHSFNDQPKQSNIFNWIVYQAEQWSVNRRSWIVEWLKHCAKPWVTCPPVGIMNLVNFHLPSSHHHGSL